MPRQQYTYRVYDGTGGHCDYKWMVTWVDDPPERVEAVAYFESVHALFPDMESLPGNLRLCELPLIEAQAYLDAHPFQFRWHRLDLKDRATLRDDDLARLEYIPELDIVRIFTSKISDNGINHLRHLRQIRHLCLYSENITDRSLAVIQDLVSLQSLDLQGAPNISQHAFTDTIARLPKLEDSYPPSKFVPPPAPEPNPELEALIDDWRQRIIFGADP